MLYCYLAFFISPLVVFDSRFRSVCLTCEYNVFDEIGDRLSWRRFFSDSHNLLNLINPPTHTTPQVELDSDKVGIYLGIWDEEFYVNTTEVTYLLERPAPFGPKFMKKLLTCSYILHISHSGTIPECLKNFKEYNKRL